MRRVVPNIHIYRFSTVALGVLIPVLVYSVIFFVFSSPKSPSAVPVEAYREVRFTQSIEPLNPIQKVSETIITPNSEQQPAMKSWTILTPEPSPSSNDVIIVPSPIAVFEGSVTQPFASVLLEISSLPTVIAIESDAFGQWTWTNYGLPLTQGEHTLAVYTLDSANSEPKAFAQQFALNVSSDTATETLPIVDLPRNGDPVVLKSETLASLLAGTGQGEALMFKQTLNHGERSKFFQGQTFEVNGELIPLRTTDVESASISYALYDFSSAHGSREPIATFDDTMSIPLSGLTLAKHLTIKYGANPGTYVLTTLVEVDDQRYMQQSSFVVELRPFTPFALTDTFTDELQDTRVIGLNVIIFLIIIVMILVLALLEYRRFFMFPPVDENLLVKKGYFIIKKK